MWKKKRREREKEKSKESHKAQIPWYVGHWPGMQMAQIQALQSRDLYLSACNIPSEAPATTQPQSFTLVLWFNKNNNNNKPILVSS